MGRSNQTETSFFEYSIDVMNEQTTGEHHVGQNITNDDELSRGGFDAAEQTDPSSVEGFKNFKKLHSTEKSMYDGIQTIFS